jgi:hypothetical protein
VRIRDSVDGKAIGWVKAGETVAVTSWAEDEDGNAWAFIGNGYVMGEYFVPAEETIRGTCDELR